MAKKADRVITTINDTLRIPEGATILTVVYKTPDGSVLQTGGTINYSLQLSQQYTGAIMVRDTAYLQSINSSLDGLTFTQINSKAPYFIKTDTVVSKDSVVSCVMTSNSTSQVTSGSIEVIITYAIPV
jgi:hypothetical protein